PNGERYTIVSGHRRRAAIMLIRDGGSKQFEGGVPCIVEYGEASDAMRKLRLIYANASTRQLSSAEQSRQAEEVTRLLYELKAQGVEFPGRMRDHVAQACGVTKSKIARLHAIRENLAPELLCYFDDGLMVEDVAYQLSRFPVEIQEALSDKLADGKKRKMPIGSVVDAVLLNLEGLQKPMSCRAHAGGPDCHQLKERIVRSLLQPYSWAICDPGRCCMDCHRAREGCPGACREARDRANVEKAAEEEKKAERERDAEISQQRLKDRIRKRAAVLLPYAEAAGLQDKEKIFDAYQAATVAQLRKWSAGDMEGERFYADNSVNPGMVREATSLAKRLGCSLELAMGLPEKPKASEALPSASPTWSSGKPKREGWYAVRMLFLGKPLEAPRCFWWDGSGWSIHDGAQIRPMDRACQVTRWIPLPAEVEA
ncbi:MAG: hypothetical protein IIZ96_05015, partial [Oscillospiraceae bacterium]|nr:hypothetical protein [Oscillospiraceae bacterium]